MIGTQESETLPCTKGFNLILRAFFVKAEVLLGASLHVCLGVGVSCFWGQIPINSHIHIRKSYVPLRLFVNFHRPHTSFGLSYFLKDKEASFSIIDISGHFQILLLQEQADGVVFHV